MKRNLIVGSFLALLVIGAVAVPAFAADLKVSCTAPSQYTDGTPITSPITFNLWGGKAGDNKTKLVSAATTCSFNRTGVTPGTQEYYVTATVAGVDSPPSNTASVVVPNLTPNAPSGTTVVTVTVVVTP